MYTEMLSNKSFEVPKKTRTSTQSLLTLNTRSGIQQQNDES